MKESWARIIDREKIRFVMFYTPQMQVFTMTESFKKANFKNLLQMSCGGASLSKVTRTGLEQLYFPSAACDGLKQIQMKEKRSTMLSKSTIRI